MTNPLQDLRILNTRPKDQAQDLSDRITQAGGIAINCPLIEIRSTGPDWLKKLPDLHHVSYALFISANAVRFGLGLIQQRQLSWPHSIQVIAIGKATAAVLQEYGIANCIIPETADSEHLLDLPILQALKQQTVLLFKGAGGRMVIEEELVRRGAQLLSLVVYQRDMPHRDQQLLQSIWHNDAVDIILITSEQALHNLFTLLGDEASTWLLAKTYLVLSNRLAEALRLRGITSILISSPEGIMNSLIAYNKGLSHGHKY